MPALTISATALALLLAAAQDPPMGPSDMKPSGPFVGSFPHKEVTEMGAGLALPRSKGDVTADPLKSGRNAELGAKAEQRRTDALQLAELVRKGAEVPADYVPKLREAIDGDILLWREQFEVPRDEYKAMRKEWLAETPKRTASEWAVRRAEWFAARDAWIAARK